MELLARQTQRRVRLFMGRGSTRSAHTARFRNGKSNWNAGIARALAWIFAHRESPRCILPGALSGNVTDPSLEVRSYSFHLASAAQDLETIPM